MYLKCENVLLMEANLYKTKKAYQIDNAMLNQNKKTKTFFLLPLFLSNDKIHRNKYDR